MASLSIGPFFQRLAIQAPPQPVKAQAPGAVVAGDAAADTRQAQSAGAGAVRAGNPSAEMSALAVTVANWAQNTTPVLANARSALNSYSQHAQEPHNAEVSHSLTPDQAKMVTRPLAARLSSTNLHA